MRESERVCVREEATWRGIQKRRPVDERRTRGVLWTVDGTWERHGWCGVGHRCWRWAQVAQLGKSWWKRRCVIGQVCVWRSQQSTSFCQGTRTMPFTLLPSHTSLCFVLYLPKMFCSLITELAFCLFSPRSGFTFSSRIELSHSFFLSLWPFWFFCFGDYYTLHLLNLECLTFWISFFYFWDIFICIVLSSFDLHS